MEDKQAFEVDVVIKKFAQKLAGNDKKTRDKALKALKRWFESKAKTNSDFKRTEMLQLWKGLHYNFWMSDKPIVQEDLAESISNLINLLSNRDTAYLYLTSFFETISREWSLIDSFRLDKFMMLVRRMLSASFLFIKKQEYNENLIKKFSSLIYNFMISKDDKIWCAPDGLKYHVLDIYFSELARITLSDKDTDQNILSAEKVMWFLEPYCLLIAHSKNKHLVSEVITTVFDEILKSKALKLSKVDSYEDEEALVISDEEEPQDNDMETNDDNEIDNSNEEEETLDDSDFDEDDVLDDSLIGKFPWDCNLVHDRLFNIARDKQCLSKNRDKIYKLVKRLQQLLSGTYEDQSLKSAETYLDAANSETKEPNFKLNSATSELLTFESKMDKTTSKSFKINEKKLKKKHNKGKKLHNGHVDISDEDDTNKCEVNSTDAIDEESSNFINCLQNRADTFGMSDAKKRNLRRKKKKDNISPLKDNTNEDLCDMNSDNVLSPIQDDNKNNDSGCNEDIPSPSKSSKKKLKSKKRKREDDTEIPAKKRINILNDNQIELNTIDDVEKNDSLKKVVKMKKNNRKSLPMLDDENIQTKEIVNDTPFLMQAMSKVKLGKKFTLSTPINKLKQLEETSSKKKVFFQLNRNTHQEFIKTQSLASASPITPFNPDSQPSCGILKEKTYNISPINLFKNKKTKKKNKKNKISL